MLQLPRKGDKKITSVYTRFGLRDLPFPTEPVVDPYNADIRRNGTIYAEAPAKQTIEKFESLLIRPTDFTNRARLAYLWAKGDQQTGRGMGKTALLRYFRQRINKDWGLTEFAGQFSANVVYVSFPSQVDRRYMEQLAVSGLVDVCRNGVLDASRAFLRQQELPDERVQAIVKMADGTESPANLLDDSILASNDIDTEKLNEAVLDLLVKNGVHRSAAAALATGTFEDYLRSFRKDKALEPFYVPHDTKLLDYSRHLLFNDVVSYLMACGFSGGYLFIDDIENLVDQMVRKARIEFAKEFALCTVRPGYVNTANNFFLAYCVLTSKHQWRYLMHGEKLGCRGSHD